MKNNKLKSIKKIIKEISRLFILLVSISLACFSVISSKEEIMSHNENAFIAIILFLITMMYLEAWNYIRQKKEGKEEPVCHSLLFSSVIEFFLLICSSDSNETNIGKLHLISLYLGTIVFMFYIAIIKIKVFLLNIKKNNTK